MSRAERPRWVVLLERIGRSDLHPSAKALLRVMLEWVDLDTGVLWPSVPLMAERSGQDEETVRRTIRKRLIPSGILTVERTGGGVSRGGIGLSTVYRIAFDHLPEAGVPRNPGALRGFGHSEPRQPVPTTPAQTHSIPCKAQGEPSIHQPSRQPPTIPAEKTPKGAWMDGKSVRDALREAGVRGPNLEALTTAPGISIADVSAEWASIQASRTPSYNPAGLLATRLASRCGVKLVKPPSLAAETMASVGRLQSLRNMRRPA